MESSRRSSSESDPDGIQAFVVWLDLRPEDDRLHGVVERMVDSERCAFDSIEDLVEVLRSRAPQGPSR